MEVINVPARRQRSFKQLLTFVRILFPHTALKKHVFSPQQTAVFHNHALMNPQHASFPTQMNQRKQLAGER